MSLHEYRWFSCDFAGCCARCNAGSESGLAQIAKLEGWLTLEESHDVERHYCPLHAARAGEGE